MIFSKSISVSQRSVFLLVTLAACVCSSLLFVLFLRKILSKIRYLETSTRNMTLSMHLTTSGHDETSHIIESLNSFNIRLSYLVSEISGMANHLVESLERMSSSSFQFSKAAQDQAAATQEITATVEEISASMENVNSSTDVQFSQLSEVTEKIYILSKSIIEIGSNVEKTLSLTNNISELATVGTTKMKSLSSSMGRIRESSQEMTNIIQIINDISDKINLLSLNASIEAARAGEYGKGFAVVADEISKLADRTASSVKEIDSLIERNDKEIEKEILNTNKTVNMIQTISEGISSIDSMINTISIGIKNQLELKDSLNSDSENVKSGAEEIKSSMNEQQLAISEIVKSISLINESIQSIAIESEDIANNSVEISSISQSLKEKVDFLSK
jgi:methyl-accepting chemotaxis protein